MTTELQYDVFLSHNSADKPRVRRLAERLRAAGRQVNLRTSTLGLRTSAGGGRLGLERNTGLSFANAASCAEQAKLAAGAWQTWLEGVQEDA